MSETWRRCSVCKDEIGFDEEYYLCSVSTCNKAGRESVFCSPQCWEAHVPVMNHKEASFEEAHSPEKGGELPPVRRIVRDPSEEAGEEVLIVVSKLKSYIQKKGSMNTAGSVPAVLSSIIRQLCDNAIERAGADGRKTVMDRDFNV